MNLTIPTQRRDVDQSIQDWADTFELEMEIAWAGLGGNADMEMDITAEYIAGDASIPLDLMNRLTGYDSEEDPYENGEQTALNEADANDPDFENEYDG